jgi:hypothetical protein
MYITKQLALGPLGQQASLKKLQAHYISAVVGLSLGQSHVGLLSFCDLSSVPVA